MEGIRYVLGDRRLRFKMFQLVINILIAFPILTTVYRVFLQQKFNLSSTEFGWIFAFPAAGSLLGALTFAVIKPTNTLNALKFGIPLATVMMICTPYFSSLQASALGLGILGFALYLSYAALTVGIHLRVEEDYRGRVSAIVGLAFVAVGPMMGLPWGFLSDVFGPRPVIVSAGVALALSSVYLAYRNARVSPSSGK